ncbi:MAG: CHASE domain-containing protein [Elainellaceae cyanobacterium]
MEKKSGRNREDFIDKTRSPSKSSPSNAPPFAVRAGLAVAYRNSSNPYSQTRPDAPTPLRYLHRLTPPIALALLLGTSLSIPASLAVARWEQAHDRLQFQRQTDSLATALQRSLNRYTEVLLALGDFYRVSPEPVSRKDFNTFVQRALTTYPGIQALEWAPVVSDSDRPSYEATLRSQTPPTAQITERSSQGNLVPAAPRPSYVPVTYLQPWDGNEPALGYDLTSDPTRRSALEAARDTGAIAASGRIQLVQGNKDQFGFLVFLPLYDTLNPPSVEARNAQINGYVLGVFRVSDVVEESLATLGYTIDFVLQDDTASPTDRFLGRYDAATQTLHADIAKPLAPPHSLCPAEVDCTHSLAVAGRQWAIAFAPGEAYPAPTVWQRVSTLLIGLLLTTLVVRYLAHTQAQLTRTRELSALKIRLFSMASHELRTPLSTILLSAQTLEADALLQKHRRTFTRIRTAAKRMNQLLNDLLILSRAESGKLQFARELLKLHHYCHQVIDEVRFSVETAPAIRFNPGNGDAKAYLDPQLLRAILTNLLSNAVKYSGPDPQVSLTLSHHLHQIIFEVQDQGIGIPAADQDRLHEAFYRGCNVGDVRGTGLGLSVVNACLQLHQGTLTYQSTVGQGTTFRVTLPQTD